MALLQVEDLHVSFRTADGIVQAVRGASFRADRGQTLGIVGESGSGKSVATQTIMGLTRGARISGRALFEGRDLLTMSPGQLQAVRGAKIGMIFQDPLSSLHPFYRVGWQLVEMIRLHERMPRRQARERAVDLLALVGIPQPVQQEFGTAVILITHDLGVIAEVADDVLVMYGGTVLEEAGRLAIFTASHHPYTEGLLESLPAYGEVQHRLRSIPGQPPSPITVPAGCPFPR